MVTALFLFALLITCASVALLAFGVRSPPMGPWDAIVVAGCRVHPDGRPSAALVRRVNLAVQLHRDGLAPLLVLTGGAIGGPVSEAGAAATLARAAGIADEHLRVEDASTTTRENARFAAALLGEHRRVLVVTDAAHALRCQRLFRRHFAAAASVGAPLPWGETPRALLRELGANLLETLR